MRVGRKGTLAAFGSLALVVVTACNVTPQSASVTPQPALSCGADPTKLLGTWMLTTINPPDDDKVVGAHPRGILIFDAACNISFQLMGDRLKHMNATRGQGTSNEHTNDAKGTIAYFGTYKVDGGLTTLTIIATRHSFPNLESPFTASFSRSITFTPGSPATLIYKNSFPSTTKPNSGLVFSRP